MPSSTASIVALFGASGSGKSYQAKRHLEVAKPSRLLLWDTMDEYGAHARAARSLGEILQGSGAEAFAWRYVPRGSNDELADRFEAFCAIAFERGRLTLVVEELQRVTSPSWAPAAWSDCTLRGRHKSLEIFALAQRPASVDKNLFSNCTYVRSGRLNFIEDQRTMASVLAVPLERIQALTDREHVGRNMLTGRHDSSDAWAPPKRSPGDSQEVQSARKKKPGRGRGS